MGVKGQRGVGGSLKAPKQVKFLNSRQQVGFYYTAESEEEEAELQQAGGGAVTGKGSCC